MDELGKIFTDWWGALAASVAASPLLAIGTRRLLNTYTKTDVVMLVNNKVDPLHELIIDTRAALKENTVLLTDVRLKLAERRASDP